MKKVVKFLLVLLVCFQLFLIRVNADSGFYLSYGGSSGSFGSSFSSGSHHNVFECYIGSSDIIMIIFLIIGIIFYALIASKKETVTENTLYDDSNIKKAIPEFNQNEFLDMAYNMVIKTEYAWMNIDYDTLRTLLTDELFNKYKSDLEVLELKGNKNIMSDFKLRKSKILSFNETKNEYNIVVFMQIELKDYIVDKNKRIIRGNKKDTFIHNYEFVFIRSKEVKETKCPNCGTIINDNASKICPNCNSQIVSRNNDWVIASKESKFQRLK